MALILIPACRRGDEFLPQRNRRQRMTVIAVMVMAAAIGTRFRFEWGLFGPHACTQSFQHFLEYRIHPNAQKLVPASLAICACVCRLPKWNAQRSRC